MTYNLSNRNKLKISPSSWFSEISYLYLSFRNIVIFNHFELINHGGMEGWLNYFGVYTQTSTCQAPCENSTFLFPYVLDSKGTRKLIRWKWNKLQVTCRRKEEREGKDLIISWLFLFFWRRLMFLSLKLAWRHTRIRHEARWLGVSLLYKAWRWILVLTFFFHFMLFHPYPQIGKKPTI